MKKLKKRNIMEISSDEEKEKMEEKVRTTNVDKGTVRR